MTPNIGLQTSAKIVDHATREAEAGREACGIVVKTDDGDDYIEMANVHPESATNFRFDQDVLAPFILGGKLTHYVHSHMGMPYPSEYDMVKQLETGLPWIICDISTGRAPDVFMWGHPVLREQLLGRRFRHGVADCYALVRDYYRIVLDVDLPIFPRQHEWWHKLDETGRPINLIEGNFANANFSPITESELRAHDVIGAAIGSDRINHCGIFLGDGLVLHHMYNAASKRHPYQAVRKHCIKFFRYNGEIDAARRPSW